jgi:brachyury protein
MRLSGLEETALYTIQLEFRLSDGYKYRFVNGEWKTSPRNDSCRTAQPAIVHKHADSPNFGHHWTKETVSFNKLKLTNNENTRNADAVFLRSLNKYDPIIQIYKHDKKNFDDKVLVFSKLFKETQFIAVTAYQNEQVNSI